MVDLRPCTSPTSPIFDKSGTIDPSKGPAFAGAKFHVDVFAQASDATSNVLLAPRRFKCEKNAFKAVRAQDDAMVRARPMCHSEGKSRTGKGASGICATVHRPPVGLEGKRDETVVEFVSALR